MQQVLLVGCGGFIGAAARYLVGGWVQHALARPGFPFGTLAVNLLGSFILGFVLQLGTTRGLFGPSFREFVAIGMLGGFTTFSTFSWETTALFLSGDRVFAVINMAANLGSCVLAVFLAQWIVLAVWG